MENKIPLYELDVDEKRLMLQKKLMEDGSQEVAVYSLSYNQRALWFLHQLSPESPAYNINLAFRVLSPVDIATFEKSVQIFIDRHPSLRTTFTAQSGEPFQIIHAIQKAAFEYIDISDLTDGQIQQRIESAAKQPISLESGPIFRTFLFRTSPTEHLFLFSVHHIVFDALSILLTLQEFGEIYRAESTGSELELPRLKATYIDFVDWQKEMLSDSMGQRLRAYWMETLSGKLPVIDLPTDHPRPPVLSHNGASHHFKIETHLVDSLEDLARAEGITLFHVLFSAFAVLLYKLARQEDILIGTPAHGRSRSRFMRVVGNFFNMLVLRMDFSGDPTFRSFLHQVKDTVWTALKHQNYPYALIIEKLAQHRHVNRFPLYQVSFSFQQLQHYARIAQLSNVNADLDQGELGGMKMERYSLDHQEGQLDITLEITETYQNLFGVFKYNTDLFDLSTIEHMQSDYISLLHTFISNPDQHVSEFRIMSTNMDIFEFLSHLRSLDVQLSVDNGRLRVNAPAGALDDALKSEIGRRKEQIIATLGAGRGTDQPDMLPLVPVDRKIRLPLSFSQQRLWFLEQLDPGNATYNMTSSVTVIGRPDVAALRSSLTEIVRRHESLRTSFHQENGQPYQVINKTGEVPLPEVDLSSLPAEDRQEAALRIAREDGQRPFDLTQDVLLRGLLIHLSEDEHLLVTTVHHIASDAWSSGVMMREMAELYQASRHGQPSRLPALPIQYGDFAYWQRTWLSGSRLEAQLDYWKAKLAGKLPSLDLPTDHPRPPVLSYRGDRRFFELPLSLIEQVKSFSNRQGVTPYMTYLAAFNALMYRYTGQEDILVGTPVANRRMEELENLVGFFVNNLVIRTNLSGINTFRELLLNQREITLEAFTQQDLPFEKLVDTLHLERDMSRTPLFQVMFSLQNIPMQEIELPGLKFKPNYYSTGISRFDLTIELWEQPKKEMIVVFEYSTDLFEAETIERLFSHYHLILENVLHDPDQQLDAINILEANERQQLLLDWNVTEHEYPADRYVHELFQDQAARTPDAIAASTADHTITYHELNQRANRLGRYLQSLDVGPGDLIGVFLNRSIDMLVALLGIQKAGAAYLPLDPMFPRDRLEFMLADSAAPVLITETALMDTLPANQGRLVSIDADWPEISQHDAHDLPVIRDPERLAYIIYTSGSTGRPKGVQVYQRGFVNFLTSIQDEPGLSADDILLSVTTLSFDISGLELFLPLISGAQVVIPDSAAVADGPRLLAALADSGATVMQATPATWRLMIASGWQGDRRLKVLCGGEALPEDLAHQLLERCGSLWNMYGPTETTVWSTIYPVDRADGLVPIGRPIGNTRVYILDKTMKPVPIGVPGELFIGGDGVAMGYLNRPDLNAEKFIPDPFSEQPSARMYRTGDLARYRTDGTVDFLGRMDHQVKIRGYRIELGEIEAVLGQHPAIDQAVVVAREDSPGDKRLVAYLIANQEPAPTTNELRNFLREKLPDYMLPPVYYFLDAIPLTPNGKVDRRALPAPEGSRPELGTTFVAPRNDTERAVAEIWGEALHLQQVGINDNFFELGGHSLMVVEVHNKIQQQFDTNLTIAHMFQYPTIGSLSQYLQNGQKTENTFEQIQDRVQKQKEALTRQNRVSRT